MSANIPKANPKFKPKVSDVVWAKLASYPYWPSRIDHINWKARKASVHFFGSKDTGQVRITNIRPYKDFKDEFSGKKLGKGFLLAMEEAEEEIAGTNGSNSSTEVVATKPKRAKLSRSRGNKDIEDDKKNSKNDAVQDDDLHQQPATANENVDCKVASQSDSAQEMVDEQSTSAGTTQPTAKAKEVSSDAVGLIGTDSDRDGCDGFTRVCQNSDGEGKKGTSNGQAAGGVAGDGDAEPMAKEQVSGNDGQSGNEL